LSGSAELQATSIMRVIGGEGFDSSYQRLTSYLWARRGPMRGNGVGVTMPIETGSAEEFKFDWSDCNRWARRRPPNAAAVNSRWSVRVRRFDRSCCGRVPMVGVRHRDACAKHASDGVRALCLHRGTKKERRAVVSYRRCDFLTVSV
jgi:hypothetical protein